MESPSCIPDRAVEYITSRTVDRVWFFFFQAEDGIRDLQGDWSSDVCSSDLKSECSDLSFEISHLSLQAGRFATHPARIAEPNSIVCETCGRNPGERQCFLTASAGQPGSVWVLLPPSDLNKFDFPNGYVLLLDPAPPGTFTIGSVW